MGLRFPLWLLVGLSLLHPGAARASPAIYTDPAAFSASLPAPSLTANFDALPSGTAVASGGAADGITFSYSFGGATLLVTNGTAGDANGPFDTATPPNFLGTNDFDALLDGDSLSLGFAATNAIGIYIVTAEEPGATLLDGDIALNAAGTTALLDVDHVIATRPDGSLVYFLGVIDPQASFTTASVATLGGGSAFAYTIDQIVRTVRAVNAVPLQDSTLLLGMSLGLLGLLLLRTKRVPR